MKAIDLFLDRYLWYTLKKIKEKYNIIISFKIFNTKDTIINLIASIINHTLYYKVCSINYFHIYIRN